MEDLRDNLTEEEVDAKIRNMINEYELNWKFVKYDRLSKIKNKIKGIGDLKTYKALEKYISLREQVELMSEAMDEAVREFDDDVNQRIDIIRGK